MTNTRTLDRDCCDYEVYSHGKVIGVFDMPKDEANQLVVKLSKKTGNRIDWHYVGGRVVMKMLPPKASLNSRTLKSRNQREGWYHGCEETHRRVHRWFSLRNRKNLTETQKRLYLHQHYDHGERISHER